MLMNEQTKLSKDHYKIFGLSWAGWVFDFYDLVLFTFLISELLITIFNIASSSFILSIATYLYHYLLPVWEEYFLEHWVTSMAVRKYWNGQ